MIGECLKQIYQQMGLRTFSVFDQLQDIREGCYSPDKPKNFPRTASNFDQKSCNIFMGVTNNGAFICILYEKDLIIEF